MNADISIDITGETCPMTFVRTKIALENMSRGQVLAVVLRGDEPAANVPRAVRDHGHEILEMRPMDDGRCRLLIRVAG
ncbi:MAG: sulfurtransferase TusA family protein [Geminicoccaceae bacterium]|nr:sulfurtransferase TusA family protein [Geminicoccaceae bacterium]